MARNEAFRISLRKFEFDCSLTDHHKKELSYRKAIEHLLRPLNLADRLHFRRRSDAQAGMDWLVLEIESSGQLSLLEDDGWGSSLDLELARECQSAEHLARAALATLRKLVSLAKMSPTQFHRLLQEGGTESEQGLRLMVLATDSADGVVAVRTPQGRDDIARTHPMPRRVTLPDIQTTEFMVHMVGRTSALVQRVEDRSGVPKPVGKKLELFWGNVPMRAALAARFHAATEAKEVVTIQNRETLSRKGRVVRLEWCPNPEGSQIRDGGCVGTGL